MNHSKTYLMRISIATEEPCISYQKEKLLFPLFVGVFSRIDDQYDVVARRNPLFIHSIEFFADPPGLVSLDCCSIFSNRTYRESAMIEPVILVNKTGSGAALPLTDSKDTVKV